MTHLTTVAFLGVFALIACVALTVSYARAKRLAHLRRRLGELKAEQDGLVLAGDEDASDLRKLLDDSGLGWTMADFVQRAIMAASMGVILGAAMGSGVVAVMFGGIGGVVVLGYVRIARARRLRKCDEQMPQALEIMALALRAGHALPSALELAAAEAPSPIADELRRAADEHALGRPIAEVLEVMGQRLPGCDAVNTFVVAVLVLQETGGNLISVIDRIVDNARARASYKARLAALTAEGRTSAKLLAVLPVAFAVLAAAADKGYAQFLLHDRSGNILGMVAIVWWLLGIMFTRKLVASTTN